MNLNRIVLVGLSLLLLTAGCALIYDQGSSALDDLDGRDDVPDSIFDPDLNFDPATDENRMPFIWRKL
jgi:hypothetical protein